MLQLMGQRGDDIVTTPAIKENLAKRCLRKTGFGLQGLRAY
jgi:hypothetical protein